MSAPQPTMREDFESRDVDFIRDFLPILWLAASFWYRAEVRGLEKIPRSGGQGGCRSHRTGNASRVVSRAVTTMPGANVGTLGPGTVGQPGNRLVSVRRLRAVFLHLPASMLDTLVGSCSQTCAPKGMLIPTSWDTLIGCHPKPSSVRPGKALANSDDQG